MAGFLVLTTGMLAGCAHEPQRRTSVDAPQWVGPLSEAEFDAFATSAASRLHAALSAHHDATHWIAPPIIEGGGLDAAEAGPDVALRFAHGINDRLGRGACFAPSTPWPTDLFSRLELRRDPREGTLHVTLVVHDPNERGELVRHAFAVARTAPVGERLGGATLAGALPPRDE